MRANLRFLLGGAALVAALSAVSCDDGGGSDGDTKRTWHVVHQDLPGAILSIWARGLDDIWITGADGGDGAMALHFDGSTWQRLQTGAQDDLWWVFGGQAGAVYFVGDEGQVIRHDRTSGAFTKLVSPTTATLYGIWGPPTGPLYTVGGFLPPNPDPPVVLRVDGDTVTEIADLPADRNLQEIYFKVWGSGPDDVWVIGDRGTTLHYDGQAWTKAELPGARLVTIHGAAGAGGVADLVIVGGLAQGQLFEYSGGTWADRSPDRIPQLAGVFVGSEGQAVTSGMRGYVAERRDGVWTELELPPVRQDWHAAWVDPNGDLWVGGGDLMSGALTDGAVLRYGPDR